MANSLKTKTMRKRASVASLSSVSGADTVRVLVGPKRRAFYIHRQLLASTSAFFRDSLDVAPIKLTCGIARLDLILENQCPMMFELFASWITHRGDFQDQIDAAEANNTCTELHWDFVNLHLFAAQIDVPALQDLAMDALQDLHLRCNWDISPQLIHYAYLKCDPSESCRLRKWIVAMTAFSMHGIENPDVVDQVAELFDLSPDFWDDYVVHNRKMSSCKLGLSFKNPQLRLHSNDLRHEERQFGFRQCSFHTHRSSAGEGPCPHTLTPAPLYQGSGKSDPTFFDSVFSPTNLAPINGSLLRSVRSPSKLSPLRDTLFSSICTPSRLSPLTDTIFESDLETP